MKKIVVSDRRSKGPGKERDKKKDDRKSNVLACKTDRGPLPYNYCEGE